MINYMQNGTFQKCHSGFIFPLHLFLMSYLSKNTQYSVISLIPPNSVAK